MTTVSEAFAAGLEKIRKSWGRFLLCGILLMVLGMVCIGKAQTATTFSILALGWVLVLSGVVWLFNSFYLNEHQEVRAILTYSMDRFVRTLADHAALYPLMTARNIELYLACEILEHATSTFCAPRDFERVNAAERITREIQLCKWAQTAGLSSRKSRRALNRDAVHAILRNRIYTGDFNWNGKTYRGIHDPIISLGLWDKVQSILRSRYSSLKKND
jgi:Recombinase/Short repeat of unknown function (DUF308)